MRARMPELSPFLSLSVPPLPPPLPPHPPSRSLSLFLLPLSSLSLSRLSLSLSLCIYIYIYIVGDLAEKFACKPSLESASPLCQQQPACPTAQRCLLRQVLYFCIRKASKLSTFCFEPPRAHTAAPLLHLMHMLSSMSTEVTYTGV
jgi:hypothetical protein